MDSTASAMMDSVILGLIVYGIVSYLLVSRTQLPREKAGGYATGSLAAVSFFLCLIRTTGFSDLTTDIIMVLLTGFSYFVGKRQTRDFYKRKEKQEKQKVQKD